MKTMKILHLASFNGNIGDNANHSGFYSQLRKLNLILDIDELEIREFYWKKRQFDSSFVELVNEYDLLIVGGGNYFELWVEDSPTGTSVALPLNLLKKIKTPILFNALGVDPGQGVSESNIVKFQNFLDILIERGDFISIRNDGARKAIKKYIGSKYLEFIVVTPDAGFLVKPKQASNYYKEKDYISMNVACDMDDVRFSNDKEKVSYKEFVKLLSNFIESFTKKYPLMEIVMVPHIYSDISLIDDILVLIRDDIRRNRVSVAPLLHGKEGLDEIISIYSESKVVLANRFHANICNIGMEIPTIGLVNYRQISELYKELRSDSFVDITKKDLDKRLMTKVSEMIDNKDVKINKSIVNEMHSNYSDFLHEIEKWVAEKRIGV
jgi:polysaccharide pyruvyl transferase WcaK-like protein